MLPGGVCEITEQLPKRKPPARAAFHGLDLYSLYVSIRTVLNYLDEIDPSAAKIARERYGCLTPWQGDPATYGHAALIGSYRTCEQPVVGALRDLLARRLAYAAHDGERFFDAVQNARLVANAERYYRVMYYGSRASWNLRDEHMFTTLKNLLAFYGPDSKAIVWAHNSHVGDSEATEMASRGEHNIGHLCRQEFGAGVYSVGFGTNSGTVAAASDWDGPMEIKRVQPALPKSYERLCHAIGHTRFMLGLRDRAELSGAQDLGKPHLERAMVSSTGRRPSALVTISRPCYRGNSTSTSGSTKPAWSRRSTPRSLKDCPIPIPSGCERRRACVQGHRLCSRQAELDARRAHLA
jgi:erythromycin esterase-like protein